jgi:hypothetical protein
LPQRGRAKQAESCALAAPRALPLWHPRRSISTESQSPPKPTLIAKPTDSVYFF